MSPRLLWISIQGFDPDRVLRNLKEMPYFARFLASGSFGFTEMEAPAVANISEEIWARECGWRDLPWQEGLSLPTSSLDLVRALHAREQTIRSVTIARGESELPGHLDIQSSSPSGVFSAISEAVSYHRNAQEDFEILFVEIPFGQDVLGGQHPALAKAMDLTMGACFAAVGKDTRVMVSSTISANYFVSSYGIGPQVAEIISETLGVRMGGEMVLFKLQNMDAARKLVSRLEQVMVGVTKVVAEVEIIEQEGDIYVEITASQGMRLVSDSRVDPNPCLDLGPHGMIAIGGEGVRKGALLTVPVRELMSVASSLCQQQLPDFLREDSNEWTTDNQAKDCFEGLAQ